MGGELTVKSTPGRGSTFTVRLYLNETTELPPERGVPQHPVSGYIGARRTLLVVDDQPTQRQMLAGLLLPLGFRLREAASGTECLQSVLQEPPDAVLLDITMDDLDGWETARRIRAAGFLNLPILMVSANAFENLTDKLSAADVQGFIDKPVIESELLTTLQRVLQIEWVAQLTLPSWITPLPMTDLQIPPEYARTLIQLARLGHRQGLAVALDRLVQEHPDCAAAANDLRALVERFAWNELIASLQRSLVQLYDKEDAS
jgi:CheY-like chemotaxis protein